MAERAGRIRLLRVRPGDRPVLPDAGAAACLADEDSPTFLTAGMFLAAALFKDEERLAEAFRTGAGVGWGEHHHDLYVGVERFFRPGYAANLVSSWIPALDGVQAKLATPARPSPTSAAATARRRSCSHRRTRTRRSSASTTTRRRSTPRVSRRPKAGVADRVRFEVASAQDFPGEDYDLVCIFDALHDMGDPVGAARHIRSSLADGRHLAARRADGRRRVAANLNPVGRLFYSASTLVCTPSARSQPGGWALGAQATDEQLRSITEQGGFSRFRRAVDTPVNRIIEVRP